MKRCWMLLVCLGLSGIVGCMTEPETAAVRQGLYQGPPVSLPKPTYYQGGALPAPGPYDFWVIGPSYLKSGEELAVRINTKYGTPDLALRIKSNLLVQFTLEMGKTGSGYLRPGTPGGGGSPVPPNPVNPDEWYGTFYTASAFAALEVPEIANRYANTGSY